MSPHQIGQYEIRRRLGGGGMGVVYLGHDLDLDRPVAIKVLKEEFQDDPELRARFLREARAVARLKHTNIVIIFRSGEDEGRPFMAMEYIAGDTLKQWLQRTPTPPLFERLKLVEALCAGLSHAHDAGIIHRDIKPANLMIDSDGVLKILDFGIARVGESNITVQGSMMGSFSYMSPEQAEGTETGRASDIFAVGAVLYEVIALRQAFPGEPVVALQNIKSASFVPLDQSVPGVVPDLVSIVHRALEREPASRFQDVARLGRDLARVRRRIEDEQAELSSQTLRSTAETLQVPSPSGSKPDSDHRRRLTPERFAELRRQQVAEHLKLAEDAVGRADYAGALLYAERALTADPDSKAAVDLIDRIRFAIDAASVRRQMAAARRAEAEERFDEAWSLVQKADGAARALPEVQDAASIRAEAGELVISIGQSRSREIAIRDSLARARTSIDQGGIETALRAVYEVLALDPDRSEARELEQRAHALLREQRERERSRREALAQIAAARALAGEERFDDALAALTQVSDGSDTVRAAAADARSAVLAAQRRSEHARAIARAHQAVTLGDFADALAAIATVPDDELTPDAVALRATALTALEEQREAERRRRLLEVITSAVSALLDGGDYEQASVRLAEAEAIDLRDERAVGLRRRIDDLQAAAEERRRAEALERLAMECVSSARALAARGEMAPAIEVLARHEPAHPLVDAALLEIRALVAEEERRQKKEARRREAEARQRAERDAARAREEDARRKRAELAAAVVAAEEALQASRPDEATIWLKRAESIGYAGDVEVETRVVSARSTIERQERARREEEERLEKEAARRREEEARQRAEQEAARKQEEEARRQAAAAEAAERAAEHQRAADAARERARIADAEIQRLLDASVAAESPEAAIDLLNTALGLQPSHERALALRADRRAELARVDAARVRQFAIDSTRVPIEAAFKQGRIDEAERLLVAAERQYTPAPFATVRLRIDERRREQARERAEADAAAARDRERIAREQEDARRQARASATTVRPAAPWRRVDKRVAALLIAAVGAAVVTWSLWPASHLTVPTPGDKTGQEAGDKAAQENIDKAAQEARGKTAQETRGTAGQVGRDTTGQRGPDTGGQVGRDTGVQVGRDTGVQVGRDTTGQRGRDTGGQVGRGTGGQEGRDTTGQGGRDTAALGGRDGAGQVGRDTVAQEALDKETREKLARDKEALDKEARERAAQAARDKAAAQEALDKEARDKAVQVARDKAVQEALDKEARDKVVQVARDKAEQEARDRQAIGLLLKAYADAYSLKDQRRLKELDPDFVSILRIEVIKSVTLTFSPPTIVFSPDGQSARLTATGELTYVFIRPIVDQKTGKPFPPKSPTEITWTLRKKGVWAVVSRNSQ